jgi:tetratricopeptide (TPR) repeat protein
LGRLDEALVDAQKNVDDFPDYRWSYYIRGLIYRDMGDVEKARADLTKACEMGADKACTEREDL